MYMNQTADTTELQVRKDSSWEY